MIRECLADPEGARIKQACDWIGIEKPVFIDICQKELTTWDKRQNFISKTYYRWEIGQANAAPPQKAILKPSGSTEEQKMP